GRLGRLLTEAAYASRPYCVRCGQCCRRAGPALFREDLGLIETGVFAASHLLTLRPGEPGWSPFEDRVVVLDHEVVTIKTRPEQGCLFFEPGHGCRIYEDRPQQCRQLECWNPNTRALSASDRHLDRRDFPLNDTERRFLNLQDKQAPFAALVAAVEAHKQGDSTGVDQAVRLIEIDLGLRRDAQQAGLDPAHFDFLLGRPLVMVLPALGFILARDERGAWTLRESLTEG
ncbi:MAG: YkgJ family cysteine cluster protein, partial [Proteobacteria bacterium]|nr:YkgJ family cysteine cluster protein [Pseudomonadota bacterium]